MAETLDIGAGEYSEFLLATASHIKVHILNYTSEGLLPTIVIEDMNRPTEDLIITLKR